MTTAGRGEAGDGRAVGTGARPSYAWNTDAIRGLTSESVRTERLRRVLQNGVGARLEVVVDDQTAFLRGVVATEHDRVLAGHLARFEPGVRYVRNELSVAGSLLSQAAQSPD